MFQRTQQRHWLRRTTAALAGSLNQSEMSTPDRATVNSGNRKEFKTPLTIELESKMTAQGFYPVSQFMKECLTHPQHGYYSSKKQVIGSEKADFITAAEIPFFADVLAAWVVDCWQKMGTPRVLHLVELGPGRGTLMRNMLKQIKYSSPQFFHFLQVHLVDVGAARVEEQKKALAEYQTANQKIKWWMSLDSIPFQMEPTIFIANEYFDALPVAQFRYSERGWCETCLEIDDDPGNEAHFRLVNAPSGSFTAYLIPDDVRKNAKLGDAIEINAVGMQHMEQIMKKMIDCNKAAALIVDYGKDDHMSNTLRGIRNHKFIDPLLSPGDVDLSAWVSFKQLRWTLERLEVARRHLKWFPVMTQQEFLEWGGIDIRLAHLIKDEETKSAMKILQSYRRLCDPAEMGETYKVFAVQTRNFPNVSPYFAECVPPPMQTV
jgi:NADH dehydrogenase [ubiquinone] 1 alpha subcomplex assembly factor 7